MSAVEMLTWVSHVKKRFGPRLETLQVLLSSPIQPRSLSLDLEMIAPSLVSRVILFRPGSWMGRCAEFHRSMRR